MNETNMNNADFREVRCAEDFCLKERIMDLKLNAHDVSEFTLFP